MASFEHTMENNTLEYIVAGTPPNTTDPLAAEAMRTMEAMGSVISICVPIIFTLIVLVGLVGNSLVVIVVKANPQMLSTTNLLIINLAIADLLFIVFCVPFTAWDYAFPYWPFGSLWCKVVQYLIVVCAYASIYTLVLMSVDRYLAVAHPIRSISWRTLQNATRAIKIMWVIIIMFCVPTLFTHDVIFEDKELLSVCTFRNDSFSPAVYQLIFFFFSYIIPILMIIVLYILMLRRLWFGVIPGRNPSSENVRSKKKVTRLVVTVVIIFAVCWFPIQVVLVLKSCELYPVNTPARLIFQITGNVLAYMNSCVNPILYAFLSENFRKHFRRVIVCCRKSNRTDPTVDNRLEQELTIGPSIQYVDSSLAAEELSLRNLSPNDMASVQTALACSDFQRGNNCQQNSR